MVNIIWFFLIIIGIITGIFNGKIGEVTQATLDTATLAVQLSIGFVGIWGLWLGLMKVAEKSGLIKAIGKVFSPFTRILFPDIPKDHPAMGAMIMNMTANMIGLGNAATPLGIKAMKELQSLNKDKTKASNAMCTFLVINTSSIQIIPTTVIALRITTGSRNPTEIIATALIATTISTLVGLFSVKILEKEES